MALTPATARRIFGSLAFRLLALLSLALMPIGAIAVFQTAQLSEQLRQRAESSVLGETFEAVEFERGVIERAYGTAETLGRLIESELDDAAACSAVLKEFIQGSERYIYSALMRPDGVLNCSSGDEILDYSGDLLVAQRFEDAKPFASSAASGRATKRAVLIVGQPVLVDEVLSHFILLSIPQSRFTARRDRFLSKKALSVLTFNVDGQVLDTGGTEAEFAAATPKDRALALLTDSEGLVFAERNKSGEDRVFSVVPIYGGVVFAIASWDRNILGASATGMTLTPWFFPIAMWLATLVVTYFALNRLVVRHVRRLGRRMRRFEESRDLSTRGGEFDQPAEFEEMNRDFLSMAGGILQDEAELEDALREKSLLIREVHHRVKNNLQLIASIMNMQIRRSRNSETTSVVRRLQDRVLGLARVHRQMYEAQTLAEIPVDELLHDILSQSFALASRDDLSVKVDLVPLSLISDQAVPLALLVAEAGANAVKYAGAASGAAPSIRVSLTSTGPEDYQLVVENSVDPERASGEADAEADDEGGLGMQLIRAFVMQLNGTIVTEDQDGIFRLVVSFRAAPESAENMDVLATTRGRRRSRIPNV